DLAAHERVQERCLPAPGGAAQAEAREARAARPRRARARRREARSPRVAPGDRSLRRPAAAARAGPRTRAGTAAPAVGRTVVQPRRKTARGDGLRAETAAARAAR